MFKKDFLASIIIFLVALPLAIGISIACNLPIYAGIISAIIGGVVVGALSGNSLQVSGPAAGLILIVIEIVRNFGLESLFGIIFLAGIIQIIFGIFSLGNLFRAISPAIIQGMLVGIGVSIFFTQFHIMLDSTPADNFLGNIYTLFHTLYYSVLPLDGSQHHIASFIGFLTIFTIVLWENNPKLKKIPSALIAVMFASLVAFIFHYDINYIHIGNNFWSEVRFLKFGSFFSNFKPILILEALIITFIASAETLLTSTAIDKMSEKSKTDYNKEIIAQGVGNSIVGFLGGLPITGVIVRSVANINAGAETRFSTVLHGFWVLLFVSLFPQVLNYIPISSLAAILVYTGYKLVDIKAARHIYSLSKGEFVIYLITVFAILFTNLFEGILIGVISSILKNLYKMMKINIKMEENEEKNEITVKLSGNLTFLQLPALIEFFEKLPSNKNLKICVERLYFIDHACIDFIKDIENARKNSEYTTEISWHQIKQIYPSFKIKKMN